MSIKGSDIVRKLPNRKNCRECGFPTCFAFAMKLAAGGTTIDKCPYISEQIKAEFMEAMAPPIKLVTFGKGTNSFSIGNEEVVFRHEGTFVHRPGIALLISDDENDDVVKQKLETIRSISFNWIGRSIGIDIVAVRYASGDKARFEGVVEKACRTNKGIILIAEDVDVLFAARDICAENMPLCYPITKNNIREAILKIKIRPVPVGIKGESLQELANLASQLKDAQIEDIVLDPGSKNINDAIRDQTLIRRSAVKHNFRPLGYPTIGFPCFLTDDKFAEILIASMFVIKYAGIVVVSNFEPDFLLPLLINRLNIYTDPQRPFSMEEGVYKIGSPTEKSPVLLASSWALTYLILSAAIEEAKMSAFLCVKHIDEADVLCWCSHCLRSVQIGNLNIEETGKFMRQCGIENMVVHRKLIIPGRAGRFKTDLASSLPGWEIIPGPADADRLSRFLPEFHRKFV